MAQPNFKPWEHPLAYKIPSWCNKDGTPSQAKYFTWLRSQLRGTWSDNPLRTEWKKTQLRPVTREERLAKVFHSSTKNVGQCYLCEEWFAGSKLECDHKKESDGCVDFETAEDFLWHCAANPPENWELACKPCHKIKSYSERMGITFEEARVDKEAILICKGDEKVWLISKGINPGKNAKIRRQQVVEVLKLET